jgi:hypothetical protein
MLSPPPRSSQTLKALALAWFVVVERVRLRLFIPTLADLDLPSFDVLLHRFADIAPDAFVTFFVDGIYPEYVAFAMTELTELLFVH